MARTKEATSVITRDTHGRAIRATRCSTEQELNESVSLESGWIESHEQVARNCLGLGKGQPYRGPLLVCDLVERGLLVGRVWTVPR